MGDKFWIGYLWLMYNVWDVLLTHAGLTMGYSEGNPFGHILLVRFGAGWMYTWKISIVIILLAFVARISQWYPLAWALLRACNIVLCAVVVCNLWTMWH